MQHKPIVIVGGGPIGLTTALLLAKQGLTVTVLDAGGSKLTDGRVLALSYASVNLLVELNAWPAECATAINRVHISHSGFGVTKMLAQDVQLPELGYTIKYSDICAKLNQEASKYPNIEICQCIVSEIIPGRNYATLVYHVKEVAEYITTDLAIVAEGGRIQIQNVAYKEYDYQQTAIIAEVKIRGKHNNTAYEHFDNEGAMVLLPYADDFVLVWSLPIAEAQDIKQHNTLALRLGSLNFMKRFGQIDVNNEFHSFGLKLQIAKTHAVDHTVLIGNSAQILHPISAQGMNLGLRDARDLSDVVMRANQFDNASMTCYNRLRDADAKYVVGFTHNLAKFMELNLQPVNFLRGAGIVTLSNCRTIQNFIANSLIFGA